MMTRRFAALATLLIVLGSAAASNSQSAGALGSTRTLVEMFEAANVAASRGDHRTAVAGYEKLLEAGVRDPDVYYNLATSYARLAAYPRAILNYERVLVLRPREDKAAEAVRDAEAAIEEGRAEVEGEATIQRSSSMSDAAYQLVSEDALAYALLASNLVFFVTLGFVAIRRRKSRASTSVLAVSALLLLVSALGLATKAGAFRDGPRAVALEERLLLREAPDPRAQVRGQARGGDRGVVLSRDRDFVKLRVVSGAEGWTPASSVGLIDTSPSVH